MGDDLQIVGQALSTRTDLLPTDKAYYAIGLSQLQDAVDPSFDSTEARQIISDELGQSVDEVFGWLSEEEPVASASIGQVYRRFGDVRFITFDVSWDFFLVKPRIWCL